MKSAQVGNGKAVHLTEDEEHTLCGHYVSIILDGEPTCKGCLAAGGSNEPSTGTDETEDVGLNDLEVGDTLIFDQDGTKVLQSINRHTVGRIKLRFEDGDILTFKPEHRFTRKG